MKYEKLLVPGMLIMMLGCVLLILDVNMWLSMPVFVGGFIVTIIGQILHAKESRNRYCWLLVAALLLPSVAAAQNPPGVLLDYPEWYCAITSCEVVEYPAYDEIVALISVAAPPDSAGYYTVEGGGVGWPTSYPLAAGIVLSEVVVEFRFRAGFGDDCDIPIMLNQYWIRVQLYDTANMRLLAVDEELTNTL
jgi:hypothetical protein